MESVDLKTGSLTHDQLRHLLNRLGLELTFIDDQDIYRFWTDVPNPIFERTASILGTPVLDCHPEESHERVMAMLEDLRSGRKDSDSHWSRADSLGGRRVFVTYRAIRDDSGKYLGCVEIVQDVEEIKQQSAI